MPEMLQFCGRQFRVYRRVEKVFLDRHYYVARLGNTVLLDDLRCDGSAHGGCQMGCLLLWREAWLKPAGAESPRDAAPPRIRPARPEPEPGRFACQATALIHATSPLPWWDVRQYAHDLLSGELTAGQITRMFGILAAKKLARLLPAKTASSAPPTTGNGTNGSLHLQPGELVEVKPMDEIRPTLDRNVRTRGLSFGPDMARLCGRRFRVARRVDRLVVEWTGQLRPISDTVALAGVTCDGLAQRGCPRNCYHLWRECWLRRVETSLPASH